MPRYAHFRAKKESAPRMSGAPVVKSVDQARLDKIVETVKASPAERARPIPGATKKRKSKRAKKIVRG